jgi:hypothetical protein
MSNNDNPVETADLKAIAELPSGIIVVVDKDGKNTLSTIKDILRQRSAFIPEEKIYLVGDGLKAEDIWPQQIETDSLTREAGTLIMRQNFILSLAQKMNADIYVLIRLRDEKEFVSCLELAMCGYFVILGARWESGTRFLEEMTHHINRQSDISVLAAFQSMLKAVIEVQPEAAEDLNPRKTIVRRIPLNTQPDT